MTCAGCARGLPILVLDADGVKVEISGKAGKPSHAVDDAWWLCTTHASREDLIAENARLQSLIPTCAECGEVILDNGDIRCVDCSAPPRADAHEAPLKDKDEENEKAVSRVLHGDSSESSSPPRKP